MTEKTESNYYHCNKCGYEGQSRVSGAGAFILMIAMLCLSVWFLPMVIVALAFMAWMITKPAKRYCPSCKSTDLSPISDEQYEQSKMQNKPPAKAKLENHQ